MATSRHDQGPVEEQGLSRRRTPSSPTWQGAGRSFLGRSPAVCFSKPELLQGAAHFLEKPALLLSRNTLGFGLSPELLGLGADLLGQLPDLFGHPAPFLAGLAHLFASRPNLLGDRSRLFRSGAGGFGQFAQILLGLTILLAQHPPLLSGDTTRLSRRLSPGGVLAPGLRGLASRLGLLPAGFRVAVLWAHPRLLFRHRLTPIHPATTPDQALVRLRQTLIALGKEAPARRDARLDPPK